MKTRGVATDSVLDAEELAQPDESEIPLLWSVSAEPVRSREHLATLVGELDDGQFGTLEWAEGGPAMYAQALCLGDEWLIEPHDGNGGHWRAHRGGPDAYPARAPGDLELYDCEVFDLRSAVSVLWWWQQGVIADGVSLTRNHLGDR